MTTMPRRFRADTRALAAAAAAAGVAPGPGSLLPPPAPADASLLRAAGLMDGGAVDATLAAGLAVAADPGIEVRVTANGAGRPVWVETRVAARPGAPVLAAVAEDDGMFDIAVMGSRRQAVLLLDELIGITDLVAGAPEARYDLDLPGFVALLAAADVLQFAALMARIERAPRRPPPPLGAEQLHGMVERGLQAPDTRWAVTAGAAAAPVGLGLGPGDLAAGLRTLAASGLVEGRTLTGEGYRVASALNQLVGTASLVVVREGSPAPGWITLFRCATAIWAASWGKGPGGTSVTLLELDHTAALGVVEGMLSEEAFAPEGEIPGAAGAPPTPPPDE